MADLEDVEGDAAAVASAGPLRVEAAGGVVGGQVDRVIEDVDVVGGAPGFGSGELDGGVSGDPAAGAEVAAGTGWCG